MKQALLMFILMFHTTAAYSQSQAINQLVYEIRDPNTDAEHFRNALEKIGEYLALEILEELETKESTVRTLTGADATHALVNEKPMLVTILRAGLPLTLGVQKVFPNSDLGFLAMSHNEETLKAKLDYVALPNLTGQTVIIIDPMLATGGSMLDAIHLVERFGPKRIFVVAAIAAEPGIVRIRRHNPGIKIFAAAIDPKLNDKGYIIPGLGDAGDRSYGLKHYTRCH